jgi:hypothetical protein|nr:MAG TPA: hypothetical protein [Caudoviricetes sp.]
MPEDIRLAKGEDLDALTEKVNTHIENGEIHVTAEDKENWNGKADLSMLDTEGYLKKKMVGALPSMTAELGFSDGVSKFNLSNRCSAAVDEDEDGNMYQKITTGSNAANMYAFAYLDFTKYTAGAREFVIEFDTKINGDRWYIGLSDLTRRPGESSRSSYDRSGVVFSQGTKDGKYYYINNDLTWKDSFFGGWVHSRIEVNCELKTVTYHISNGNTSATLSGKIDFYDTAAEQVTGLEIYSYVNNAEMGIDNICIVSKFGVESNDERTVYVVPENGAVAEYIYIDGKPVCIGRSDIFEMVNDLLARVEKLENN